MAACGAGSAATGLTVAMVNSVLTRSVLPALLLLGACANLPQGPSIMALPGSNKNFAQFRFDDSECRQFASLQINGGKPGQSYNESMMTSAVVGTAVGAIAGAAMGGSSGAGVGAGFGLITGTAIGSGSGYASGYALQQQYDNAYVQCMYAKNNKVPVSGRFESRQTVQPAQTVITPSLPPPGAPYPPPPPGNR